MRPYVFIIFLFFLLPQAYAQISDVQDILEDQIKGDAEEKATEALIQSTREIESSTQDICEKNPNSSGCKSSQNLWGVFWALLPIMIIAGLLVDTIKGARILIRIIQGIMDFFSSLK